VDRHGERLTRSDDSADRHTGKELGP